MSGASDFLLYAPLTSCKLVRNVVYFTSISLTEGGNGISVSTATEWFDRSTVV